MGSFYRAVKEANDIAAGKVRKREPRVPDVDDCEEMPVGDREGPVELSVPGAKSYRRRQRVKVDGHWRVVKSINAKRGTLLLVRASMVRRAWWGVRVAFAAAWASVRRFPSWLSAWWKVWKWNRDIDKEAAAKIRKLEAEKRAEEKMRRMHEANQAAERARVQAEANARRKREEAEAQKRRWS